MKSTGVPTHSLPDTTRALYNDLHYRVPGIPLRACLYTKSLLRSTTHRVKHDFEESGVYQTPGTDGIPQICKLRFP